ncbi:pyridoxamine 5'-phosphate oxidase family protein [Clostridium sp. SHJSY1]|uniref:pyridoxamine 5'-phosphate oxidase family protein n=1 Tax=Clostridium sp. SHJSY1 TaxID=2942483 RepID=UPI002876A7C1|nr:pyridoxamine 5'-phosphate oxidase family protein [Clostridium sp. SHJSY1]MDS0527778.1 pyridoxamine 5'-phosphate oxidase family protein [Clostridium sp. SHJSY1]
MRKSLIICENNYYSSKKVAKIFSLILGMSKVIDIEDLSKYDDNYENVILIIGIHGMNNIQNVKMYLEKNNLELRVGIIGVGITKKKLYESIDSLFSNMDKKIYAIELIKGKVDTKEVCTIASKCSEIFNIPTLQLNKEELSEEINKYVYKHNTCVLSTGFGKFVRSTPIEYIYEKGNFYFITEGGIKFRGILENSNVSISIFDEYKGMKNLKGLQISGEAEILNNYNDEYIRVAKIKNIDIGKIKNMPVNLNIIKVKVKKFEFLNSDFSKRCIDVKQIL